MTVSPLDHSTVRYIEKESCIIINLLELSDKVWKQMQSSAMHYKSGHWAVR